MIQASELEKLGFSFNDKGATWEEWLYELDSCTIAVQYFDHYRKVEITIYESGFIAEVQLKGEVTVERLENLIKALQ
jgi:hypothetical protein